MENEIDNVNHPKHYTGSFVSKQIECIDVTRHLSFDRGNAVKYLWRAGHKGGPEKCVEDIEKAKFYVNDMKSHGMNNWLEAALGLFVGKCSQQPSQLALAAWEKIERPASDEFERHRYDAIDKLVRNEDALPSIEQMLIIAKKNLKQALMRNSGR